MENDSQFFFTDENHMKITRYVRQFIEVIFSSLFANLVTLNPPVVSFIQIPKITF